MPCAKRGEGGALKIVKKQTVGPCSLGTSLFTSIQTGTIPQGVNAQNRGKGLNVRGRPVFRTACYVFRGKSRFRVEVQTGWGSYLRLSINYLVHDIICLHNLCQWPFLFPLPCVEMDRKIHPAWEATE